MPGTLNQAQAASFIGKSIKTFRKYLADGIISKEENGKYDPQKVAAAVIAHLTERAAGRQTEQNGLSITDERARYAKEQADKIAMENAIKRNEFLPRGEIEVAIVTVLTTMRTRLLALPAKLAPELAIKKKAVDCAVILTGGVTDALDEISKIEIGNKITFDLKCGKCGHIRDMPFGIKTANKTNRQRMGGRKPAPKSGGKRRAGKVANK